jgi:deazaflavin-dependent oxidoreductase (nitroreductase family)
MDARSWAPSSTQKKSERQYSLFHLVIQRIASTKLGSSMLSFSLHHLDRIVYKITGERTTLSSLLAGIPVIVLTTTGAKSGLPRTTPVLCLRDEYAPETFAIVASNFGNEHHPAWYYNLKAHPRVMCKVEGRIGEYFARQATGEDYERLWQRAEETYFGFSLYKQRAGDRLIPIFVMTPEQRKSKRK